MIEFQFADLSSPGGEGVDPDHALNDLLALLASLKPDRVQFAQIASDDALTVYLGCFFGDADTSKIDALKRAVIIAEGEAGFRSIFHDSATLCLDGYQAGMLDMLDPRLPSGERIAVCYSSIDTLAEVAAKMRLGSQAFGYALDILPDEGSTELARALIPAISAAESRYARVDGLGPDLRASLDMVRQPGWRAA